MSLLIAITALLSLSSCNKKEDSPDFINPTNATAMQISQGLEVPPSGSLYGLEFYYYPLGIVAECPDAGSNGWIYMEVENLPRSLYLFMKIGPNDTGKERKSMLKLSAGSASLFVEIRQKPISE